EDGIRVFHVTGVQTCALPIFWRAWPAYDPSRAFSTWMYRIALNTAISWLRGEGLRRRHAVPLDEELHEPAVACGDTHEEAERLQIGRAACRERAEVGGDPAAT